MFLKTDKHIIDMILHRTSHKVGKHVIILLYLTLKDLRLAEVDNVRL